MPNYQVVNIDELESNLTAIADRIREHTGNTGKIDYEEMPEQIDEVRQSGEINGYQRGYGAGQDFGYGNGYTDGYAEGYDIGKSESGIDEYQKGYDAGYSEGSDFGREVGIREGKQAEHSTFWDDYQQNGTRKNYASAFYKSGWSDVNFKPKYDLAGFTNGSLMFSESRIADLVGILDACRVEFDSSQCTNLSQAFYWCKSLTSVPVVDTRSLSNDSNGLYALFGQSDKIESIEKLILKDSVF